MMTQLLRLLRLPRKRPLLNFIQCRHNSSSLSLSSLSWSLLSSIRTRESAPYGRRVFSSTFDEHTIAFNNNNSNDDFSNEDEVDDDLENLDRTLKDMFVRETTTYQNVWTSPTTTNKNGSSKSVLSLLPLIYSDKRLDRQSRFLLQLLQTLYDVGLTNTSDRVTTERCNAIINRLATVAAAAAAAAADKTKTASSSSYDNNSNANKASAKEDNTKNNTIMDHWQRVERARSILECMEMYLPSSLSGQKFPMELPIPNHKTYFSILRMYSSGKQLSSYDANALISLSEDTTTQTQIQTMNNAPLEAVQIVKRMEESNQLSLVPTSMHWNQVLSCYANTIRRPNRPLEAAKLLYELLSQKQNNTNISDNDDNDRGSTRITSKSLVDGSSFSHTLRCCVNESALEEYERSSTTSSSGKNKLLLDQNTSMKEKEKYAKLALGVAQRVWSGLKQQQDELSNPNKTTIGLIVDDNIATDQINGDNSLSSLSSSSATTTAAAAAADNMTSIIGATAAAAAAASTNTNVTIEMNSFHFVHMIRVARNFATLLLIAELEQKQKTNTVDTDIEDNIITEIRQRHEEWIRTIVQECIQKQKVNIYILQEILYQGEIMNVNHHNKHEDENENDGTSNNNDDNDNDEDKSFEWIKRVMIMPSSSSSLGNSSSSNILYGMNMKWDKEILPALVIESNKKKKKKKKKTKKNNTYATVIQQTRILFKYIPSRWISKAD